MASSFDSIWDGLADRMDDAVDGTVSDTILYALDGVTFTAISGYIFDDVQGETAYEQNEDTFDVRKRVKIRKSLVGTVLLSHRLRHPRLGTGTFRPMSDGIPQSEGRYWLFEVQKV